MSKFISHQNGVLLQRKNVALTLESGGKAALTLRYVGGRVSGCFSAKTQNTVLHRTDRLRGKIAKYKNFFFLRQKHFSVANFNIKILKVFFFFFPYFRRYFLHEVFKIQEHFDSS